MIGLSKVSVIIPTLNRKGLLAQCLRSLLDQTYRDFEIIVVDGGSSDGTKEVAQLYPVKFVRQNGRFVPSGWNYGIMISKGEILVFVDDDVIATRNWLEYIVGSFKHRSVGGVGGRVIIPNAGESTRSVETPGSYLRLRNKVFSVICENKLGEIGLILRSGYVTPNLDRVTTSGLHVQSFQGCNMAFRRAVFEAVGLFDESYAPTSFRMETEFCLRAFAHGVKLIYNPQAVVYHQVHEAHTTVAQGRTLGRTLFYNAVNTFTFAIRGRKQIPRFSWIRFILIQLLSAEECLRLAVRRKTIAYLLGPLGTLDALRSWISNSNDVRRGRIPRLSAQ